MKLNNARSIHIGSTPVNSVYLGEELIWPELSPEEALPEEYTRVTAIQPAPEATTLPKFATIDTGVIMTEKIRVEFECLLYDYEKYKYAQTIAGFSYSVQHRLMIMNCNGLATGDTYSEVVCAKMQGQRLSLRSEHYMAENVRYTVTVDNDTVTISGNGESWSFDIRSDVQTWTSFSKTFCIGNSSPASGSPLRIYGGKIYENGKLIRNFVPVKHVSGAAGLFDLVGSEFYRNAATFALDYIAVE